MIIAEADCDDHISISEQLLYVPFELQSKSIFWQKVWQKDCHMNVHVSAHFQKSSRGSKKCCLFFPLSRSHEDKQVAIILGIKEISCTGNMHCCSCESNDKTICLGWTDHSIINVVNEKAIFLMKCYLLWSRLKQMYFQQKVEQSLDIKTLQQCECSEFQINETANCSEWNQYRHGTRLPKVHFGGQN